MFFYGLEDVPPAWRFRSNVNVNDSTVVIWLVIEMVVGNL